MSRDALLNPGNDIMLEVEALKNMLVSRATGGDGDDNEYQDLRKKLISNPSIKKLLPRFILTCRDLSEFWGFIKSKFAHYAERREFLREEFNPLLLELEQALFAPAVDDISQALSDVDSEHINFAWNKALERKNSDPEGAITMARTLLETVCKHVLDESNVEYNDGEDLPKLYRLAANRLNLAPSQHTEKVFKQILGGCQAVVEGLGSIRNRLSDSHGKSKKAVRPARRHAELAVNLAGSMAKFVIETHEALKAGASMSIDSSDVESIFDSAKLRAELSATKRKLSILEDEEAKMGSDARMLGAISAIHQELNLLNARAESFRRKLKITDLGFDYFDREAFEAAVQACGMVGAWEKLDEAQVKIPTTIIDQYKQAHGTGFFHEFFVNSCFEIPDDDEMAASVSYYLLGSVLGPGQSDLFLIGQWSSQGGRRRHGHHR